MTVKEEEVLFTFRNLKGARKNTVKQSVCAAATVNGFQGCLRVLSGGCEVVRE